MEGDHQAEVFTHPLYALAREIELQSTRWSPPPVAGQAMILQTKWLHELLSSCSLGVALSLAMRLARGWGFCFRAKWMPSQEVFSLHAHSPT